MSLTKSAHALEERCSCLAHSLIRSQGRAVVYQQLQKCLLLGMEENVGLTNMGFPGKMGHGGTWTPGPLSSHLGAWSLFSQPLWAAADGGSFVFLKRITPVILGVVPSPPSSP